MGDLGLDELACYHAWALFVPDDSVGFVSFLTIAEALATNLGRLLQLACFVSFRQRSIFGIEWVKT
jgi:hypothetical protein